MEGDQVVSTTVKTKLAEAIQRCVVESLVTDGGNFYLKKKQLDIILSHMSPQEAASLIVHAMRSCNISIVDSGHMWPLEKLEHTRNLFRSGLRDMITVEDWSYSVNKVCITVKDQPLIQTHPRWGELSTYLSGGERFSHRKQNDKPAPCEKWNNDLQLTNLVAQMLSQENRTHLRRNDIRSYLNLTSSYYTPFPISAAMYILTWAAKQRPSGKLDCYLDPCAGWGDRLVASMFCQDVVEHYVGFDPWQVAHRVCRRVIDQLRPLAPRFRVDMLQRGAERSDAWPESDLVFTSPPYGNMEHYNCDSGNQQDGQAWRLQDFTQDFLFPFMRNAAKSTRKSRGLVIINIANAADATQIYTHGIQHAATAAGMKLKCIFGLQVARRPNNNAHVIKAEPIFVFEHPTTDK